MNEKDYYTLYQIDELTFKYDMSLSDIDIIDVWLNEYFIEGKDFIFGETLYGTHAYTVNVIFYNTEDAVAFKIRWA